MKVLNKRNIIANIIIALACIANNTIVIAQVTNIPLPNGDINTGFGGGAMTFDILEAQGKIFMYSSKKILVYNTTDGSYSSISFGDDITYGKFNPIFYQPRLHMPDINLMVVDNEVTPTYLYFVDPDLRIQRVNISTLQVDPQPIYELPSGITTFNPLHGSNVLKYDNHPTLNRIYWMVKGKSSDYGPGNFHERDRYFAILEANTINPDDGFNCYFQEFASDELDPPYTYQDINITDIEFNHDNNFFYLSKMNKVERWEITPNGPNKIELRDSILASEFTTFSNYYKFGQLLYINNSSLHKIIALPYSYPGGDEDHHTGIVIDGGTGQIEYQALEDIPGSKITDAIYIESGSPLRKQLMLSYAPDEDNGFTDICVYDFIGNTFIPSATFTYNTNHSIETSNYDINTSLTLSNIDNSNIIIGKKDEIVKLCWSNGEDKYIDESIKVAESNFFTKSTSSNSSTFLLNSSNAGIEEIDNTILLLQSSIQTGFPVYNIEASNNGDRLYCFNTLAAENTGLFVYRDGSSININDVQTTPENGIEKAVGDVVYNPYTGDFLVSENGDFGTSSCKIKIYNEFENNGIYSEQLVHTIYLPAGVQYATTMAIAPNKKLYIMANMHKGLNPVVLEYSAETYIQNQDENEYQFDINDDYDSYTGHFCYNPINQKMYATIHHTEITLDPYQHVANTIFEHGDPFDNENNTTFESGIFFEVGANPTPKDYPSKIICPDQESGDQSQYNDYMIVIGKKLSAYNYQNGEFITDVDINFSDIVYSKINDRIYGIVDDQNSGGTTDRKCVVKTIDIINDEIVVNDLSTIAKETEILGQCSGIFYNEYDNRIYIYNKMENNKLGMIENELGEEVPYKTRLYHFEPSDVLDEEQFIELGVTSIYPELDHNEDYHYFFYNLITPYFDPNQNYMYFPNGGHSCISKVTYSPNEAIYLRGEESNGITWLSFPRLANNPEPFSDVETVLGPFENGIGNILPQNFESDEGDTNTYIINLVRGQPYSNRYFLFWGDQDPQNLRWKVEESFINDINSTYGYKIQLKPFDRRNLFMQGNVQNANSSFELVDGTTSDQKQNWVGYYIHEEQDIFDALGDFEEDLFEIKHQDYYCYKTQHLPDGGQPHTPPYYWVCDREEHNINYGEMIVLNAYHNINNFSWEYTGKPPSSIIENEPEHFTFTETLDYSALIVELDSTENPVELGAFVNDSCIGACTVTSDDTIVIIKGYLDGQPGDSIVFEEYFGTKSSQNNRIKDYFVLNERSNIHERRTIKASESKSRYFISFKNKQVKSSCLQSPELRIYPNPSSENVVIEYDLLETSKVNVAIYDRIGRTLATIYDGEQSAGSYNFQWNIDSSGHSIKDGLYVISLTINGTRINEKLIIQ